MLHCIVVTGLITTNPWRWRCYVPSKLQDTLKHLLPKVTDDQNQKQRMFITCCSKYKAEVQRLYNHMRRSIQPLYKQSLLIHCSVILNKLAVTQAVKKLSNFMKPKHSSPCSQNHTLKHLNPDHTTTLHSFRTHFNITLISTTK
jgi:hypothetical protein